MKKTRTTRSLLAAVSVVALTAALYGCSGSDGGGGAQTGTPSGPTQDEQVAALQAEINALRAQLGLAPDASLGDSITALQAEVKRLQDEAQVHADAEQAARDKAMAAEARKLAIGLDTAFPQRASGPTIRAKYGRLATATATFQSPGANPAPNFKAENSRLLGTLDGWSGTELMSTVADGSITDVIHVYTNVGPDELVPFAQWASVTTGVAYANGAVTVAARNSALIKGAAFATASGSKTHELNVNTDADAAAEMFQTPGTFGGASGTYTCAGTGTQTCTSAVASGDGGVILAGTGATWTFTPDNGAMAAIPDDSYVNFGWWLRKTDSGYFVHRFVGTTEQFPDFTTVAGTATYSGSAVGKYSIYDSGPKGGHFTAKVELKVDFGSVTDVGTVSGMVSNFSDGAGTDPAGMDTWEVTLPEVSMDTSGLYETPSTGPTAAQRPVWRIDGEAGTPLSTTAQWGGILQLPDEGGTPQAAVGWFDAEYGVVGNLKGAYGANHSGP